MITGYVFAVGLSVVVLVLILALLRTRRIREKYAAIWILLGIGIIVLSVFQRLAFWLASAVGVETPVNLLFALAFAVLFAVCIQMSTELSTLEEETRTLAEEVALLRLEVTSPPASAATAEPWASPTLTQTPAASDDSRKPGRSAST